MILEDQLYEIERQFWTGGAEVYRAHADEKCLTIFPEMAALLDREQIAQSAGEGAAGEGGRWQDVAMTRKGIIRPARTVTIISYEATAKRSDGRPYRALVSTAYVRRGPDWKMTFHQQTPLET
jgi:hypothetical protein